jgi:HD superfamily phosphohydrolase
MADTTQQPPITSFLEGRKHQVVPHFATQKDGATSSPSDTPRLNVKASRRSDTESQISPPSKRQAVMASEEQLSVATTIQDVVHGPMEFHALQVAIMDTPQFQRLRDLKQLGCCDKVYPTANHNRFVHSLGVAYFATKFVSRLRTQQPELRITDKDELCVGVAALCHDLGHGPFSHMFERFLHNYQEDKKLQNWCHEDQSIRLFKHLLQSNNIDIRRYGLDAKDQVFIEEMILGNDGPSRVKKGRALGEKKEFLYDIVNNAVSGFDVDKLDYLIRDQKATHDPGFKGECIQRLLQTAVVMENNDVCGQDKAEGFSEDQKRQHICFPTKSADDILDNVFRCRYRMHRKVYTHKAVVAHEFMICDILALIQDIPLIASSTGSLCTIKEAVHDMEAYTRLNDSVLGFIQNVDKKTLQPVQQQKLEQALALQTRINRRKAYKFVGEVYYDDCANKYDTDDTDEINEAALQDIVEVGTQIEADRLEQADLITEVRCCHYGSKQDNPLDKMRFFKKNSPEEGAYKLLNLQPQAYGTSVDIPQHFMKKTLRIFCKHEGETLKLAKEAFRTVFETTDEEIGLSQQ